MIYTLYNSGSSTLNWGATKTQLWITIYPQSGSTAPYSTSSVSLEINYLANSLPVGVYYENVLFVNKTNGLGTMSSSISLVVKKAPLPPFLVVTPSSLLEFTGFVGGPFIQT